MVGVVRDWFVETVKLADVPSGSQLWYRYSTDFTKSFFDLKSALGFRPREIAKLPTLEYVNGMRDWIVKNPR